MTARPRLSDTPVQQTTRATFAVTKPARWKSRSRDQRLGSDVDTSMSIVAPARADNDARRRTVVRRTPESWKTLEVGPARDIGRHRADSAADEHRAPVRRRQTRLQRAAQP